MDIWIAAFVLQWILLLLLSVLVAGILRQLRAIQTMQATQANKNVSAAYRSKFAEGQTIPTISLPDPHGTLHSTADLIGKNRSLLLLFLSMTCSPCHNLLQEIESYYGKEGTSGLLMPSDWAFWIIFSEKSGSVKNVLPLLDSEQVTVLIDDEGAVMQECNIRGIPFGLAVDSQGHVISQMLGPTLEWLRQVPAKPFAGARRNIAEERM